MKRCYLRRQVKILTKLFTENKNISRLPACFSPTLCSDGIWAKNDTRIPAAIVTAQKRSKRLAALSQTRATNTHLRAKHPPKCSLNDRFVAQSQKTQQAAALSCVRSNNTSQTREPNKLPCASPARINIWLTLRSGYYLAQISGRRVGGLAAFSPSPAERASERGREREEKSTCQRLERNSFSGRVSRARISGKTRKRRSCEPDGNLSLKKKKKKKENHGQRGELTCGADE